MDGAVSEFVEKIGRYFEQQGLARSTGRVLGLLMLADEPLSLDTISQRLDISKASVSLGTRVLEAGQMVDRVTKRGDRRTYYQLAVEAWPRLFRQKNKTMNYLADLAAEGRRLVDGDSKAAVRLQLMEDFTRYLGDELDKALSQWPERQRAKERG